MGRKATRSLMQKEKKAFTAIPGVWGKGCWVNASTSRIKQPRLDLERNVGAQFNHARAVIVVGGNVGEVQQSSLAESRALYVSTAEIKGALSRRRIVGVVEEIQELSLKSEFESFVDRNGFRERRIVVPYMDPIKPRVNAERARSCVLADTDEDAVAVSRGNTRQQLRVNHVDVWTRSVINAYCVLQLGFCNPV